MVPRPVTTPATLYDARMGGTRWLDADQQQAWRTILRHHVLTLDRLDADLQAGHQIDLADYEILVRLSEAAEGRVRMSELARLSLVSRSRLTHRVDRLEAGGWVVRRPCPTDRRGMNAELTIEGRQLLERAAPTHVDGVRRYVIDPLQPSTLRALADDLTPALDELESGRPAPSCHEAN